jgi:amphi-Trp domain-containing protein
MSIDLHRGSVTEFNHEEHLSRRQAAERLADIAYALTAGGTLELRTSGEHVRVPVAEDMLLKRESRSNGEHVEVQVVLSWSAGSAVDG